MHARARVKLLVSRRGSRTQRRIGVDRASLWRAAWPARRIGANQVCSSHARYLNGYAGQLQLPHDLVGFANSIRLQIQQIYAGPSSCTPHVHAGERDCDGAEVRERPADREHDRRSSRRVSRCKPSASGAAAPTSTVVPSASRRWKSRRLRLRSKPAYDMKSGLLSIAPRRQAGACHPGRPFFIAFLTISAATGRNPRQRFSPISAVFGAAPFATTCHRLRPLGSINAPYASRNPWLEAASHRLCEGSWLVGLDSRAMGAELECLSACVLELGAHVRRDEVAALDSLEAMPT
jgi:hypothetical protein